MIHGKIEFTGESDGDIELAIEAALESIRRGNTSGFDRNDTGSYTFSLTDEGENADDEPTLAGCGSGEHPHDYGDYSDVQ